MKIKTKFLLSIIGVVTTTSIVVPIITSCSSNDANKSENNTQTPNKPETNPINFIKQDIITLTPKDSLSNYSVNDFSNDSNFNNLKAWILEKKVDIFVNPNLISDNPNTICINRCEKLTNTSMKVFFNIKDQNNPSISQKCFITIQNLKP